MPEPQHIARIGEVLSTPTRVQIIELLRNGPLCVGALAARLDVTQGAVSQHLRILRNAGLVVPDRRGCFVHYRLNEDTLAQWRRSVDELLRLCPSDKEAGTCVQRRRAARNRKS